MVDPLTSASQRTVIDAVTAAWDEAMIRALPDDGHRYETIDGRLYESPPADENHQTSVLKLAVGLDTAAPDGWRVLHEIGLRIGNDLLIPDLLALSAGVPRAGADYNDATIVRPALVVEVASRSTATIDRGLKAVAYARAGIPHYWLVGLDGTLTLQRLADEPGPDGERAYEVVAVARPGESLALSEPFAVEVTARQR